MIYEDVTHTETSTYLLRCPHLLKLEEGRPEVDRFVEQGIISWCDIINRYTYSNSTKAWLYMNVGASDVDWISQPSKLDPWKVGIRFARKQDAMLFKLTFA